MVNRTQQWMALLVSAAALLSCRDPAGPGATGSDTNWLACEHADECPPQGDCQCGVCTQACMGAADCADVPGAAACLEVSSLSDRGCRVGFAAATAGVCVPACARNADCGDALRCVSGVCVPRVAITPAGPVASLPDDGAAAAIPVDATPGGPSSGRDAAPGGPSSGRDATPDGPSDLGGSGEGGAANRDDAGQDAGVDAGGASPAQPDGQLGGGVDARGASFPDPAPTCPCAGDLAPDQRAPRPGEAPENAYGRPMAGVQHDDDFPYTLMQCLGPSMAFPSYTFTLESGCTQYSNCHVPCAGDADCPDGGSGDALPRCSSTQLCFLDCREGRSCPDGMVCIAGVDGAACYWPRDVLDPRCFGYCEQRPVPRDCDNWCADRLVACDPAQGVTCCDGLVCTEGGYCDLP